MRQTFSTLYERRDQKEKQTDHCMRSNQSTSVQDYCRAYSNAMT
jgi:hypothetical protein